MKILKVAFGNEIEAFVENRITDGVNVIFSNDNNKGKTILIQGLMYAMGNEPIFPSGFDYKKYYFYASMKHDGIIYEFLRKKASITIKSEGAVQILDSVSELKYYVNAKVFSLPRIIKEDKTKLVDLSLFYELFFVGQDKRNPSNVINSGYYNKNDYFSMLCSLSDCLLLPEKEVSIKENKKKLVKCKEAIITLKRKMKFLINHPDLARIVSTATDREKTEIERKEISEINSSIFDLQKKRTRAINRNIKLENLLGELNSLNLNLNSGKVYCTECGSKNITYSNGELNFDLSNDVVRKNIISSILSSIQVYDEQITEYKADIAVLQERLNRKLQETPKDMVQLLLYTEEINSNAKNEQNLQELQLESERLYKEIETAQDIHSENNEKQKEIKQTILNSMNAFYGKIDPEGNVVFDDIFATRNITFSGSEEQEYYFSRTLAIFWLLKHDFPIVMDCFRKGELSTQKENIMLDEYVKTGSQVILTSTLKDEEYKTGTKYYSKEKVNAIDYEKHANSKILQSTFKEEFMKLITSFGIKF